MRKFYSEAFEAIYEDFLDDFEAGRISEAEFREFEKDCFINEDETPQQEKCANEVGLVKEHVNT